jgi:hypothetical protein
MYVKENPAGGGTPDGAKRNTTVANLRQDEKQNQVFDLEQAQRFLRLLEPDPAAHDVGGDHVE